MAEKQILRFRPRQNEPRAGQKEKNTPTAENVVPQKWQISRIYLNTSKQHMLANGHTRPPPTSRQICPTRNI